MMYNTERGVSSLNFRKDIFERMTYIVKTETNKKPNYAKLAIFI